jgi:hypothetical protein
LRSSAILTNAPSRRCKRFCDAVVGDRKPFIRFSKL